MQEQLSANAIEAVFRARSAFCKFLSANDSGETGGHQSGILISKTAKEMLFTEEELKKNHILKKNVHVKWQDDFITESCFTWYESKNELRLTKFGRGFPLLRPEYTGGLFVLTKFTNSEYKAFILNTENDIQTFLDEFGMTPAETNRLIEMNRVDSESRERRVMESFISGLDEEFPSSAKMAYAARKIYYESYLNFGHMVTNPDRLLLAWTEQEFRLFKALEQSRYGDIVAGGFQSVDDFIIMSNKVLNRRKSRAGKSLEHHLSAIFEGNGIHYTPQAVTEGRKRPDFVFPSIEAYHNVLFSVDKLCTLAAKTTCKDRWRQVLNEANRLRDHNKYICTMQQGISSSQMDEMQAEKVILVVPKPYISTYPKDRQDRIWTIERFVRYIREMQGL